MPNSSVTRVRIGGGAASDVESGTQDTSSDGWTKMLRDRTVNGLGAAPILVA